MAQSYRYLRAEQSRLWRLSLGWLLVAYALGLLLPRLTPVPVALSAFLSGTIDLFGYAAVSTAWLRHLVLGEPWPNRLAPLRRPALAYLAWGFLATLLAVLLSMMASGMLGAALALFLRHAITDPAPLIHLATLFGVALAAYLFARLMFVPLARAVGEPLSFRESLQRTRGNGVRLLIGSMLATVPVLAASTMAAFALLAASGGLDDGPAFPSEGGPLGLFGLLAEFTLRSGQYLVAALSAGFAAGAYAFLLRNRPGGIGSAEQG